MFADPAAHPPLLEGGRVLPSQRQFAAPVQEAELGAGQAQKAHSLAQSASMEQLFHLEHFAAVGRQFFGGLNASVSYY